ncbi:hypothetical protein PPERSA_03766 [Pseudocohnilembus persalinus]|uniref:Uncharacterized protein n=1 Tax=Pseudocohnilembus persalinus TaxID=266149 RepID=A0A0V0QBX2_PSEPJ|nr:hypothetical protein PPERSA_03766 [Pseudocohnilembus persalinus]|eukprot:KRW99591.1 hypothetical protein PPERSA_03766 [Pseudocohnilembus persalinus]
MAHDNNIENNDTQESQNSQQTFLKPLGESEMIPTLQTEQGYIENDIQQKPQYQEILQNSLQQAIKNASPQRNFNKKQSSNVSLQNTLTNMTMQNSQYLNQRQPNHQPSPLYVSQQSQQSMSNSKSQKHVFKFSPSRSKLDESQLTINSTQKSLNYIGQQSNRKSSLHYIQQQEQEEQEQDRQKQKSQEELENFESQLKQTELAQRLTNAIMQCIRKSPVQDLLNRFDKNQLEDSQYKDQDSKKDKEDQKGTDNSENLQQNQFSDTNNNINNSFDEYEAEEYQQLQQTFGNDPTQDIQTQVINSQKNKNQNTNNGNNINIQDNNEIQCKQNINNEIQNSELDDLQQNPQFQQQYQQFSGQTFDQQQYNPQWQKFDQINQNSPQSTKLTNSPKNQQNEHIQNQIYSSIKNSQESFQNFQDGQKNDLSFKKKNCSQNLRQNIEDIKFDNEIQQYQEQQQNFHQGNRSPKFSEESNKISTQPSQKFNKQYSFSNESGDQPKNQINQTQEFDQNQQTHDRNQQKNQQNTENQNHLLSNKSKQDNNYLDVNQKVQEPLTKYQLYKKQLEQEKQNQKQNQNQNLNQQQYQNENQEYQQSQYKDQQKQQSLQQQQQQQSPKEKIINNQFYEAIYNRASQQAQQILETHGNEQIEDYINTISKYQSPEQNEGHKGHKHFECQFGQILKGQDYNSLNRLSRQSSPEKIDQIINKSPQSKESRQFLNSFQNPNTSSFISYYDNSQQQQSQQAQNSLQFLQKQQQLSPKNTYNGSINQNNQLSQEMSFKIREKSPKQENSKQNTNNIKRLSRQGSFEKFLNYPQLFDKQDKVSPRQAFNSRQNLDKSSSKQQFEYSISGSNRHVSPLSSSLRKQSPFSPNRSATPNTRTRNQIQSNQTQTKNIFNRLHEDAVRRQQEQKDIQRILDQQNKANIWARNKSRGSPGNRNYKNNY